jgi:hypothetical protein
MKSQLGGGWSGLDVFGEASLEKVLAVLRDTRRNRWAFVFENVVHRCHRTQLMMWWIACDQLDDSAAKTPDVTGVTWRLSFKDLGRHYTRSSTSTIRARRRVQRQLAGT